MLPQVMNTTLFIAKLIEVVSMHAQSAKPSYISLLVCVDFFQILKLLSIMMDYFLAVNIIHIFKALAVLNLLTTFLCSLPALQLL